MIEALTIILPRVLIALLPVFLFLGTLVMLDSYKLVRFRTILVMIFVGCLSALAAFAVTVGVTSRLTVDFVLYSRYAAPLVEEFLKAAYVVYLLRAHRVGFVVDAAICAFAIGAGFSAVENVWYIERFPDASTFVWFIRGFGTAVMHGGTVAILAVTAKTIGDRKGSVGLRALLPGYGLAVIIHSFYNHFFFTPVLSTALIVVTLPLVMAIVFQQSEKALRSWLQVGFDTDQELLQMILSGNLSQTTVGVYFHSLQTRFRPETMVDMVCYLRLHLELTIQAKGILLMREAGFDVPPAPDVREKFAELRALSQTIGQTGRLALLPFLHKSGRELWQLHMLDQS